MSGPAIPTTRWALSQSQRIIEGAMRPGRADERPCGCDYDPLLFGHSCAGECPECHQPDTAHRVGCVKLLASKEAGE